METRLERLVPEKESEGQVSHKESDAKGRVKYTHLEPGTYLFQAQAENYVPVTTRIDVQGQRQIERVLLKQELFKKLEDGAVRSLEEGEV